MKKIISIILVMIMLAGCFTFAVSAEGSELDDIINNAANMENFQNSVIGGGVGFDYSAVEEYYDIDRMIADGKIGGEMLGISLDYLYNSKEPLYWKDVAVSKNDLTLAAGNINAYLMRIVKERYGNFELYSMEIGEHGVPKASYYATTIANFLGNLFYPNFVDVTITFEGTKYVEEDAFYAAIVRQSGFGELLQNNWCNQGDVDFRPFIETWGLSNGDVLASEYKSGYRLGKKLVAAVIEKFIDEGPVNAFMNILKVYTRSYSTYLYDATAALFNLKLSSGDVSLPELASLHELFNIVFNDNDPNATDKLQFVQMPTNRFSMAKDNTELFLYVIIYANINARFGNNTAVIDSYKAKINASTLTAEEKSNVNAIIDALLKGDVTDLVNKLTDLVMYNINETPNDWFTALKNSLAAFFKRIADYFDNMIKLLTGEKEPPRWGDEN